MVLASVLGSIASVVGASYKVVELLDYKPKINTEGGVIPSDDQARGEISLKDVKFNYPTKKDVEVLKGVNIDITKNRVIALVGTSGKESKGLTYEYRVRKVKHNFNDREILRSKLWSSSLRWSGHQNYQSQMVSYIDSYRRIRASAILWKHQGQHYIWIRCRALY